MIASLDSIEIGLASMRVVGEVVETAELSERISFGEQLVKSFIDTIQDIVPIAVIVLFFQLVVLRRPIANPIRMMWGMLFVLCGLSFFLVGLEMALFPIGESMARQMTDPEFLQIEDRSNPELALDKIAWYSFYYTYLFAFAIGVSTTFAEPALIAVASKAQEVSGKAVRSSSLRVVVALGVGVGVALGTFRIIMGHSLPLYIMVAYIVVVIQTYFAPKSIIPLAYDSGGVTTSTVTVPVVTALGLGLSMQIPGRSPLIDGFGLIAFASVFPIISVLGYAQLSEYYQYWNQRKKQSQERVDQANQVQPAPKSNPSK